MLIPCRVPIFRGQQNGKTWQLPGYFILVHCLNSVQSEILWQPHCVDWPQSLMSIFSKTDNLSKIAIYKLYLEVEVLGLDISKFDYQRG